MLGFWIVGIRRCGHACGCGGPSHLSHRTSVIGWCCLRFAVDYPTLSGLFVSPSFPWGAHGIYSPFWRRSSSPIYWIWAAMPGSPVPSLEQQLDSFSQSLVSLYLKPDTSFRKSGESCLVSCLELVVENYWSFSILLSLVTYTVQACSSCWCLIPDS